MKTYLITFYTNYGLGIAIINANSQEEVDKICQKNDGIWKPYETQIIDTNKPGLILTEHS